MFEVSFSSELLPLWHHVHVGFSLNLFRDLEWLKLIVNAFELTIDILEYMRGLKRVNSKAQFNFHFVFKANIQYKYFIWFSLCY